MDWRAPTCREECLDRPKSLGRPKSKKQKNLGFREKNLGFREQGLLNLLAEIAQKNQEAKKLGNSPKENSAGPPEGLRQFTAEAMRLF
jgi:hypothetical protein